MNSVVKEVPPTPPSTSRPPGIPPDLDSMPTIVIIIVKEKHFGEIGGRLRGFYQYWWPDLEVVCGIEGLSRARAVPLGTPGTRPKFGKRSSGG